MYPETDSEEERTMSNSGWRSALSACISLEAGFERAGKSLPYGLGSGTINWSIIYGRNGHVGGKERRGSGR